jgi:hypothetical protein
MEEKQYNHNEQPEFNTQEKIVSMETILQDVAEYRILIEKPLAAYTGGPEKVIDYLNRNIELSLNNLKEAEDKNDDLRIKKFQMYLEIIDPHMKLWEEKLSHDSKSLPTESNSLLDLDINQEGNQQMNENNVQSEPSIPVRQIEPKATKEEILHYFMILSKEVNVHNGKPYMQENDIIDFVESYFSAFKKTPVKKYYPINITNKSTLAFFIYEFYKRYDYGNINNKIKYAELLITNFELFANENPKILRSNMGLSKRPKNNHMVIPVDKYFSENSVKT